MIIVIMGVAGAGKTTAGKLLADDLRWMFYDAEDFYSPASREKLTGGIPLTDTDHAAWLLTLRNLLIQNVHSNRSVVLACSALKETYRQSLRVNAAVYFVYLMGKRVELEDRQAQRKNQSLGAGIQADQFDELEEPRDALEIDFKLTPPEIVEQIRKGLNL
jgi:gluconokinase